MRRTPTRIGWMVLVLLATAAASAQPAHVEGRVIDAETEAPVTGATVRVDGTGRGVAADVDCVRGVD